MIDTKEFLNFLKRKKIRFFTGVPDSVLKNFLNEVSKNKSILNITAVNEGSAIALAIGNYLSSKKLPLVYLQNSGLSNAINPLISIASKSVYSIPMLLIIGWRGAPGLVDEPQHMAKGRITKDLLYRLNIRNITLKKKNDFSKISKLISYSKKKKLPVAILIKNGTFTKSKKVKIKDSKKTILRSLFIIELLKKINSNDRIISTTGYTSRELNQIRKLYSLNKGKDFYMVGGMGHSAGVALGYSFSSKNKIFCLDGDGSMLMHLGSIFTAGKYKKKNYRYILLNNNSHESVGGQSTNSEYIDFKKLSESLNFKKYYLINNSQNIKKIINNFIKNDGPNFLEVKIKNKSIENLGRPKNLKKILSNFQG